MKHRIFLFTATLMILAAVSSRASFQDPANSSDKPLYQPTGNGVTVVGTISVSGNVPESRKIDMFADPVCVDLNKDLTTEWVVTNQQKLQNVFVYVKEADVLRNNRFEVPDTGVVLEHRNCRFSPHVLGVRVGQQLSIVNADPTIHNTHPTPRLNPEWNQSQAVASQPIVKTFARAEVLIPFKDNQHPWEKAYVAVMSHPFFAVSDELGNYEIRGLPPGTYKLVFWHEKLGEQEVEVTIAAGESRRLDMMFDTGKAFGPAVP